MKKLLLITTLFTLTAFNDKPSITGVASFYHNKFEGRRTANGEIFRQSKLTGASNHLPLGVLVHVTNIKNDKGVTIRINDRMAKSMSAKGRVVDLSTSAAKVIGLKDGLTKVKIERI